MNSWIPHTYHWRLPSAEQVLTADNYNREKNGNEASNPEDGAKVTKRFFLISRYFFHASISKLDLNSQLSSGQEATAIRIQDWKKEANFLTVYKGQWLSLTESTITLAENHSEDKSPKSLIHWGILSKQLFNPRFIEDALSTKRGT